MDIAGAYSARKSVISRVVRERVSASALSSLWPLALILALQSIVSLVTLRNTAFQDEALYLYGGRQLVHYWMGGPAPLENYAFYFSGYPGVYPALGGALDMIGGLELARAFSLFCMLGVNVIIYLITRRYFQTPAALFASATYACVGSVLFLGRLATFDAFCLLLIALATGVAFQASASRHAWLAILPAPLLVLAVLAKYAAMIFVFPTLGIMALCLLSYHGWEPMLHRLAIAVDMLIMSIIVAYLFIDKSAFHAINGSTTNRIALITASRVQLFLHVLQMGGVVYVAALVGVVIVFKSYPRLRLIAALLYATSWLMPLYHIYKQEAVSLDKHIAYGLFFAAPLAGLALAWLSGAAQQAFASPGGRSWLVGLSVVLIVFTLGLQQSQGIYAQWANTSSLTYALHTQMRDGSGRYLMEDIEVARYDARDVTQPWQWNGVQYFYYADPTHRPLLGDPAIAQAISDRYFALVELSFVAHPEEARFVAKQMIVTRNYDLIAKVQYQNSFGIGYYFIFRSALVAGKGDFKSMSQVAPFG